MSGRFYSIDPDVWPIRSCAVRCQPMAQFCPSELGPSTIGAAQTGHSAALSTAPGRRADLPWERFGRPVVTLSGSRMCGR